MHHPPGDPKAASVFEQLFDLATPEHLLHDPRATGEGVKVCVQLHTWRTGRGVAVGRRGRFVEFLFRMRRSVHARPQCSSGGGPAGP